MSAMLSILMVILAVDAVPQTQPGSDTPVYLFTSFRGNGADGLCLAYSHDGFKWTALNDDKKTFLQPRLGREKLLRDPSLIAGPQGTFHLVWTIGWKEQGFGYAHSKDLIRWSEQRFVSVERGVLAEGVRNTWAPELFYDATSKAFLIVWSSTPVSRREKDHRLYAMTTRDFKTFSPPRLFFDPGYRSIDGTILQVAADRYVLFFKDEREGFKVLRYALASSAGGPYRAPSAPLPVDGSEGPSAIRRGDAVWLYYDHYRSPRHYGALRSTDLQKWEVLTERQSWPRGHRHGTVLRVEESLLDGLLRRSPVTGSSQAADRKRTLQRQPD